MERRLEGSDLDTRQQDILHCVVENYLRTGKEVGSALVSKTGDIKLSPASIRNIMNELEKKGYLSHYHTSGGRVPTMKGLKHYTNYLLKYMEPTREERAFIKKMLIPYREDIPQMISETPRVLSTLSNYLSVALIPDLEETPLVRIEIVKLNASRSMVILIAESGYITYIPIKVKQTLTQKELNEVAGYFNTKFSGMSINRAKKLLVEELLRDSALAGKIIEKNLNLIDTNLLMEDRGHELIMEGEFNILLQPDFASIEKLRKLLRALNEKTTLVQLLDEVIKSGRLLVLFGSDYNVEGLSDCAIVAAPYHSSRFPPGTIGVVGPVRMDYSRTVPLIEYTSNLITEWLM